MAHKKAGGSTSLGRDSAAQRLGVKLYGGQFAPSGAVIVRQRGAKYRPGKNVRRGTDDTLYAVVSGMVRFDKREMQLFTGERVVRNVVSVDPSPRPVGPQKTSSSTGKPGVPLRISSANP